ncbi:hypothetical protein G7054_g1060 [Neopestalotiopsis clavispora]|nr:hypothetical protein G7054_g1060 [Neopestalotiopsis clavispora]
MNFPPPFSRAGGSAQARPPPAEYVDPGYGDIFSTLHHISRSRETVDDLPPANGDFITGVIATVMRDAAEEKVEDYARAFCEIQRWQNCYCPEDDLEDIIESLVFPARRRADESDPEFLEAALELIIHDAGLYSDSTVPVSLFEKLHLGFDLSSWVTAAFNSDLGRTILWQEKALTDSLSNQICDRICGVAQLAAELYATKCYTSPLAAVTILRMVLETDDATTEDELVVAALAILTSCSLQLREWMQTGRWSHISLDDNHRYFYRQGPQSGMRLLYVEPLSGLSESRWAFWKESIARLLHRQDPARARVLDAMAAAEAEVLVDEEAVTRHEDYRPVYRGMYRPLDYESRTRAVPSDYEAFGDYNYYETPPGWSREDHTG